MRLLVVLTYYRPHWTGLTRHAAKVAEGMAKRGIDVTVLTVRHSPDLPREEWVDGVRVVRLQPVSRFNRGMITPSLLWAAPALIRQHDAVQIHTPLPEAPVIAAWARVLGRPLLMTHHGDVVMPAGFANQLLQRAGYWVLLAAGTLARAVTSYSVDYTEHSPLLTNFRSKLHHVYPPVDIAAPDREAARRWRAELGLSDKLLLGFAGRWVEEKGFDYLLQALPLIREVHPNAHLVFAGDTHVVYDNFYERCRPYLEPVAQHVTNLGLIRDDRQMANFYAMCDLFVQPSRTDMFGLTQVEAMLCSTPVVASDIPGLRIPLQQTGYGKLSPPNDPAALAETIMEVVECLGDCRPVPEAVRRVFDKEASLSQYETLLRAMAVGRLSAHAIGEGQRG